MTAAKPKRRPTPYWTRVIAAAKRRKARGLPAFTNEQRVRATRWQTCACGEQDPRIPRRTNGTPLDRRLTDLGGRFLLNVLALAPERAERTLAAIEARAAVVLAKEAR